jgi:hypothetical protein
MKLSKVLKLYFIVSSIHVDKKKTKVFQVSNDVIIPNSTRATAEASKKTVILHLRLRAMKIWRSMSLNIKSLLR